MSEIKPDGWLTVDDDGYKRLWIRKKPKRVSGTNDEKVWWTDQCGTDSIKYTGNIEIPLGRPLPIFFAIEPFKEKT